MAASILREITEIAVGARPGAAIHHGLLRLGDAVFPCALGRCGITAVKREGDGATPRGCFRLLEVLYRADRLRRPRTRLPCRAIRPADGWCDAPGDRNYNRPVPLPYAASHERLWRDDGLYDLLVVLDCNICPRVHGAGSAIFLHVARPGLAATEGCVALPRPRLERLLERVGRGSTLLIG